MKRTRQSLKQIQRRVITDVKRRAQKKEQWSESSETEAVAVPTAKKDSPRGKPRGVDRGNVYRNRSHQGYH